MILYVFNYLNIYKIGVSTNPDQRVKSFPFMNLVFSEKFNNSRDIESALHLHFSDLCIGGEFFKSDNPDFIEDVKKAIYAITVGGTNVSSVYFEDIEVQFLDNGFVNVSSLFLKLNNELIIAGKKPHLINNCIKSKGIQLFVSDFENKFNFSPISILYSEKIGTYVHPAILLELISLVDNNKYKILAYDILFSDAVRIGIKKALDQV